MNIRLMATRRIAPPFPVVDWLARRSRTQQRVVLVLLALVGAYAMLMLVGRFSLDRAWISSLTDAPVWSIRVRSQTVLVVLVGATSIAGLGAAARFAYTVRPAEGSFPHRLIYRYRDRMGPAHGWLLTALPIILGVRAAVGASGRWQAWLLFLHGPDLGERVRPLHGDRVGVTAGGDQALPLLLPHPHLLRELVLHGLRCARVVGHGTTE